MGVPALFRWLSSKYPKIVSQVIEHKAENIDGNEVPVDITQPNPNGEEFDNLYLDMNGIVHPCSHPEDRPPPANEEEMMLAIFKYTDRVVNMVRPRKILMIAVDGVAPRAKMNQQRSRRFRSAKEAKEKDEDKEELMKMLKSQNGGQFDEGAMATAQKKTWDSNAITPGTPFMDILAASLRYWCAYKANTDPGWAKLKVIISDATVPGEGEHKIMQFVRSQRSSPKHDPNTKHVIYGLDADLIMLGLATHEPHFRVLREDVFFQESKARTCHICGQKGHIAEACKGQAAPKEGDFDEKDKALGDKPFIWLHVAVLREYLEVELEVPGQRMRFDLERALDDWIFMCFFVGNDFLPHLPSLDIRENGIDTLIAIWRDNINQMGSYLTKDGKVDLQRAQFILDGLAKQEDAIFRRRKQAEDRKDDRAKRRKLDDDRRKSDRGQSNGHGSQPSGRRGSPDYSNPGSTGKRKSMDPTVAPPDLPLFVPGSRNPSKEERAITHEMVVNRGAVYKANQANKSAAAVLKSQLLNGSSIQDSSELESTGEAGDERSGDSRADPEASDAPVSASKKRKAEMIEDDAETVGRKVPDGAAAKGADPDDPPPDTVRLWDEGYADRYYEQKFKVDPKDIAFRNQVARDYVEGLAWVLLYYLQGCPSWTWYYPHHYAPFAADFVDLSDMKIEFSKGKPFKPFEQLMGVLPAASNHAIPEVFWPLMEDPESEIIDFYPAEFPIDLNGKKFAWQGVALLPFIDEKRLLDAMATKYPLLSAEDVARNGLGKDNLILSDQHPLYDDIATNFYSKRQGAPKYDMDPDVSKGLAGRIEKNDSFIPQSSLALPLQDVGDSMPSLEQDHSMSVYYHMPYSVHIHKSMLLRGANPPPRILETPDIEATKAKASSSGRSFGGVPFRNGDRGGRMNYRGRGNHNHSAPQYANPNFVPPPHIAERFPPPQNQGYAPQPPGRGDYYGSGPPPPTRGPYQYGGSQLPPYSGSPQSHRGGGHFNGQGPPPPPGNYGRGNDYYGQAPRGQYYGGR
ncbi:uncharacterized protein KY384_007114 [Bacidia gigantensis]|uniref:uncharacterized protein n=1 Tax=Bacidia gigantensis TaxID=2732470 RepID=UPI001D05AE70|nr:uncharacterized protein KY384_007114 [Bacidia gigantensis]KAG8528197.1 hypothetical protein KY384_007114 [Bacidia gigantensis]